MISLDQRKDIVTDTLKELSTHVTEDSTALQDAETKWKQVLALRLNHGNMLDLPFIADVPLIGQLEQQVASQKIAVAQLSQRYRARHPTMIAAMDSLNAAEQQLQQAIDTATSQVQTAYQTALQNYNQARSALAAQEADSLNLDHYAVDYSNLERDYDVNEKLLEQILERMHETSVSGTIENQNGRIVDRATPGRFPVFPNYRVNFGLGAVGGIFVGISLAFLIAYLDDRVKSAFDIEVVVGLPLLGIIPEIKKLGQAEEMRDKVSLSPDREASESFATLYSALQLKDESKNAQCLLVTSTIAGEGKSFIATHLAMTYAAHGLKTVVIDCDLRRPATHRVFHIENLKGVIDVVSGEAQLDDVIVKNLQPNLDVIPTGGRAKNPTQSLNSKAFAVMLSELRKRYDRIFVDTPPIAIVSDALVILPLVDGSLYSIYFNKARRKAAQFAAQRLLESNVPNFGAILNGLSGGVGGYYYSHYYDKSYKAYYVQTDEKGLKG
jgi:capsular exopolysaccharide synthesis family protein